MEKEACAYLYLLDEEGSVTLQRIKNPETQFLVCGGYRVIDANGDSHIFTEGSESVGEMGRWSLSINNGVVVLKYDKERHSNRELLEPLFFKAFGVGSWRSATTENLEVLEDVNAPNESGED